MMNDTMRILSYEEWIGMGYKDKTSKVACKSLGFTLSTIRLNWPSFMQVDQRM